MLAKIQEISTKLDKKRLYTAVGALVVALATGHLMQRNVVQPNIGANSSQQQVSVASVAPAPVAAATTPQVEVLSAEEDARGTAEEDVADVDTPEIEEVTRSGVETDFVEQPDSGPETEVASAPAETAPVAEPTMRVKSMSIAGLPSDISIDLPVEKPIAVEVPVLQPRMAELEDEIEIVEVTRSETESDLMAPQELPDVEPAAGAPLPSDSDEIASECGIELQLTARSGAMVDVTLNAPCHSGEEVTFDHAGLRFTETLDDAGKLDLQLPAMTTPVQVDADIDGQVQSASIAVADMGDVDRVALVWQGGTGLQLHALENGAFYGEPGHIWAEVPGTPDRANNGEGGYVTVLGSTSEGYAADIYTFPISMRSEPAISIEAQVLETTCGKAIIGEYLRSSPETAPIVTPVGMSVPDCDAIGEYLVLKNLPRDLTIARN